MDERTFHTIRAKGVIPWNAQIPHRLRITAYKM